MNRTLICFALLVFTCCLFATPAAAGPNKAASSQPAKAKASKKSGLRGYYAVVASKTNMTDEQKEQLAAIAKERAEALTTWGKENKANLDELREKVKSARDANDKEAAKQARAEQQRIRQQQRDLVEKYNQKIRDIMTPAQRINWESLRLKQSVMGRYKRLGLTGEQEQQIEALCHEAAKAADALDDRNATAMKPIYSKLYADVQSQVLTDSQRDMLKAKTRPTTRPKKSTAQ